MELPQRVNVGIRIETDLEGYVPEYECREAAVFTHCSWSEWEELSNSSKAYSIAHYRAHHDILAHINEAIHQQSNRGNRTPTGRPSARG